MSVLVAVSSRHGATQEIAETIGIIIRKAGFAVDVVKLTETSPAGSHPDLADYDAVVVGSAVYLGRWLAPAQTFIAQNTRTLECLPVWAFSSGPIGARQIEDERPAPVPDLLTAIHPLEHKVFPGKLDRHDLGLVERAVVSVIRVGDEDNRNWDEIATWAEEIARALSERAT